MNFTNSTDQSLLAFYESVRRQVSNDLRTGGRYRFMGDNAKQYEKQLREELDRRRVPFVPIDWNS